MVLYIQVDNIAYEYKVYWTDPFYILPKCLTVAGSKNFKLHMGIRSFSAEVHQSCQAADSSL